MWEHRRLNLSCPSDLARRHLNWYKTQKRNHSNFWRKRPICCGLRHIYFPWVTTMPCKVVGFCPHSTFTQCRWFWMTGFITEMVSLSTVGLMFGTSWLTISFKCQPSHHTTSMWGTSRYLDSYQWKGSPIKALWKLDNKTLWSAQLCVQWADIEDSVSETEAARTQHPH